MITLYLATPIRYGDTHLLRHPLTRYYLTCRTCGRVACWALTPLDCGKFCPRYYPCCLWLDGVQMTRADRWACGTCGSTKGPYECLETLTWRER